MTRITAGFALLLFAMTTTAANAIEWWHDPERGCGDVKNWVVTHRINVLPGCDGALPNGAPPGEVAMHDAKKALRKAEELLDNGTTAGVEALIAEAISKMNAAPDEPRVNWARPLFLQATSRLRNRLSPPPASSAEKH